MTRPVDIRALAPDITLHTDLCIIGSGPAGTALALELADGIRDVIVLESGGKLDADPELDQLVSVGSPRQQEQGLVRDRVLGGSTSSWWGRSAVFDENDLQARPWVPHSGWPIDRQSLEPYFDRAAALLGVGVPDNVLRSADLAPASLSRRPDEDELEPYIWTYSRSPGSADVIVRAAPTLLAADLPGTRIFTQATVTELRTSPGGERVESVEVAAPDGARRRILARRVVLAAGGIENARLLLASPGRPGNAHDRVGRYLMDHPRGPVARFRAEDSSAAQRLLGGYRVPTPIGPVRVVPGLALTSTAQARHRLLNCALWMEGGFADDDPLVALRRLRQLRDPVRDALQVVRGAPQVIESVVRTRALGGSPVRRRERLLVHAIVEQQPDPTSRMTLGDRRDRYGTPLAVVDWRISEDERRTVAHAAHRFVERCRREGWPEPELLPVITDPSAPFLLDAAHPTGTTRMALDPRDGVVDADLQVHGTANLHVVGSSVFPTSGHANPTQMIVALAIRLADRIRALERAAQARPPLQEGSVSAPSESISTPQEAAATVLVTGANGTVGRRLVPRLLAAGYRVRALTSRSPVPQDDGVEWRVRDLRRPDLDLTADVTGCTAVVHLAVEQRDPAEMVRVNAEATRALAEAAEAAGVRVLCYTSSISVYGSPTTARTTEDAPLLTASQDIPEEYWVRPELRAYGRSKLLGERALHDVAQRVEYVVLRPTVIVGTAQLKAFMEMSPAGRLASRRQRTQALDVDDVVGAIEWALHRALARDTRAPGVTVYNLSDEADQQTFGDLFDAVDDVRGARRSALHIPLPALQLLKWSQSGWARPMRRPMGLTSYPADKLRDAGFTPQRGLRAVVRAAAEEVAVEQR